MAAFRLLLALFCPGIVLYTAILVGACGMNLFPAFFGGGLFLTVYLLIASFSADGDVRTVLLGPSRAAPWRYGDPADVFLQHCYANPHKIALHG